MSPRGVLVVVEHRRNDELLREWLAAADRFDPIDDDADVDLVVADAAALSRNRDRFEALRDRERPAYLPLLLVASPRDAVRLPRDVWRIADEMLTTPVRRAELAVRMDRLLALREESVATARHLQELGRSNVDLEQFAYVAAHELSTPLAVVTGALETIVGRYRHDLDPAVWPLLDAAEEESERLQTLIQDLLSFSQAGRPHRMGSVDLDEIVEAALVAVEPRIRASGASVDVGRLPTVRGDRAQLRIVFTNLLGNAIKYGVPDVPPRVQVQCEDEGAAWRICVCDNGMGVPVERMDTIFEMFERADGGRQIGHGIGLALCRRIVERHDGRIWVVRGEDGGSVFCVSLPKG